MVAVNTVAHTRNEDLPGVRITREIPLPWLIATLFAIVAQTATVYFTQQRQGELIVTLVSEVKELKAAMQSKDMKDFEQDMKFNAMLKDIAELRAAVERASIAARLSRPAK